MTKKKQETNLRVLKNRSKRKKTVILKNEYFERLMNPENARSFRGLMQQPFPPKISYWISRAADKIQQLSKSYFAEKQKIIKRYAVLDDKGNVKAMTGGLVEWDKTKDGEAKFIKEHAELLDIEVDLGIEPIIIDLEQLESMRVTITAHQWTVAPFLKIKEEKKRKKK